MINWRVALPLIVFVGLMTGWGLTVRWAASELPDWVVIGFGVVGFSVAAGYAIARWEDGTIARIHRDRHRE